jgi:ABC-type nitrate/sulfonate/bicarbonate transport system substrate-binding protein
MKHFVGRLIGALMCMVVVSVAAATGAAKIQMSIATMGVTPFCLTLGMLRSPGFPRFREKYDLDLEPIQMQESQAPVTTAQGDLPIGECSGISTVVNAWEKGARGIVVFAVGAKAPVYQLIAAPSIKTLADLRGKRIGTPGIQTASTEAIEMILSRGAHLSASRDYELVSAGAGSARVAALATGAVSALPAYPPDSYDLAAQGYTILADEATYVPQYVTGVYVVNKEWAKNNRDVFIRLIKGMVETGQWISNPANKAGVIAWMSKTMLRSGGRPIGDDYAARLYQFLIAGNKIAFDGYAPESAVRANLAIMRERGVLKDQDNLPLGEIFDFSYLNEALKELKLPPVASYKN